MSGQIQTILLSIFGLTVIDPCHSSASLAHVSRTAQSSYVIGVDAGTESVRVGIFNLQGQLVSSAHKAYQTFFPKPGHAEQNPHDWWDSLSVACRQALDTGQIDPVDVKGLSVDSTSCSVVALDADMSPLRPCLIWMDVRSADQSAEILEKGKVRKGNFIIKFV